MRTEVARATDAELDTCHAIRRTVFVDEQGVSHEEEWDDLDGECVHFIARVGGRPVGTARLYPLGAAAKAQRVAVLAEARRHGVGAALMRALETEAARRGCAAVVLHAQTVAIPFYEAIGYAAEGPEFLEAEIPHRLMHKPVRPGPGV